jgi:hypothetical protein
VWPCLIVTNDFVSVGELDAVGMLVLAHVLFRQNLLKPVSLALRHGSVDKVGIVQNDKNLSTSVATQRAHLRESTAALLHMPPLDCHCSHRLRYFIESLPVLHGERGVFPTADSTKVLL